MLLVLQRVIVTNERDHYNKDCVWLKHYHSDITKHRYEIFL